MSRQVGFGYVPAGSAVVLEDSDISITVRMQLVHPAPYNYSQTVQRKCIGSDTLGKWST
jgi:hypothetical protein